MELKYKMKPLVVNTIQNSKFSDLQKKAVKFNNLILPITNPQICMLNFLDEQGKVVLTITFKRYVPGKQGRDIIINPSLKCEDNEYHDLAKYDSCRLKLPYGEIDPEEVEATIEYEQK